MDLKKIKKALEKELDAKRFEHTLGVQYTAAALAMRYDVPMEKALAAGLLHDCAKCIPDGKRLAICEKNDICVTEVEKKNPSLLHGKIGRFLAETQYGVADADILNAICYHTTGRPQMSALEKIIFVADYIEPGRNKAAHLDLIRKLSFEDLDRALIRILEDTLRYLEACGGDIDPMTRQTYTYYSDGIQHADEADTTGESEE